MPPVHVPSFLGLDAPPEQSDFRYLLDDDLRPKRGRALIVFVVVMALAGVTWWQVQQHGGTPWLVTLLHSLGSQKDSAAAVQTLAQGVEPGQTGASNSNGTPAALETPTRSTQEQSSTPKSEEAHAGSATSPEALSGNRNDAESHPSSDGHAQTSNDMGSENSESAAAKQPPRDAGESAVAAAKTEQAAKRETVAQENDLTTSKFATHNGVQSTLQNADSASGEDETTRLAEKYLYGNGVPQDCSRAVALLRPAAEASQVKARTLLGAMYATGHCVPRDLPNSYHWLALALRQQPKNIWVEKNLESVWNQMSSSEKQLAIRMTR